MKVQFIVRGEPRGKGRHRTFRRGDKLIQKTPEDTAVYENLIRVEYARQCGGVKFEAGVMLDLRIRAYCSIPASVSAKKKKAMEDGEVRPTKRPDADNILKSVADGLNKVAYHDDAQIVDTQIRKFYSHDPRLEVSIQSI